jgi:type IV secretion system protein VirB10
MAPDEEENVNPNAPPPPPGVYVEEEELEQIEGQEQEEEQSSNEPEVERGLSAVATQKTKNIAMAVVAVIGAAWYIYHSFFGQGSQPPLTPQQQQQALPADPPPPMPPTMATTDNISAPIPTIPVLPDPPPLVAPSPPPPPPPPVIVQAATVAPPPTPIAPPPPGGGGLTSALLGGGPPMEGQLVPGARDRTHASIMLLGGAGGGGGDLGVGAMGKDGKPSTEKGAAKEDHSQFVTLETTTASQIKATSIGMTGYMIAQGKVIEAVLETAINTDLKGKVRAIVSRDVYAESGKRVLVPRGSRLIGTYTSTVTPGQKRVAIGWTRIIRPDGVDLVMDGGEDGLGVGIDALGRAGADGEVDNHYFEVIYNAILVSTLNVMWSKGAEKITKTGDTTIVTTTVDPVTGQKTVADSGNATQGAIRSGTDSIGTAMKDISTPKQAPQPTITIDQGTRLKVFVNHDIQFPVGAGGSVAVLK